MSDWLYSFSDATVVFMFAAASALAMIILPLLCRPFPMLRPSAANTDFTTRVYGILFTLCGFALAMTLVQAQAIFRHAEALVACEASHICMGFGPLARYGDPSVS